MVKRQLCYVVSIEDIAGSVDDLLGTLNVKNEWHVMELRTVEALWSLRTSPVSVTALL